MNKTLIIFFVIAISLFQFKNAESVDGHFISEVGISEYIEIGMTLSDLEEKGIAVGEYDKESFKLSGKKVYKPRSRSFEFSINDERIDRIWFYSKKGSSFKIQLKFDAISKELRNINASDIIRNFGSVKKYIQTKPPKGSVESYWDKNTYFGIAINRIVYHDLPFAFGLNDNDYINYITVGKNK